MEDWKLSLATKVAGGARALDQDHSTWFREVNQDTLDMDDPDMDILGQVYGSRSVAFKKLGITEQKETTQWGFVLDPDCFGYNKAMEYFTECWHAEILKRLARVTVEAECGACSGTGVYAERGWKGKGVVCRECNGNAKRTIVYTPFTGVKVREGVHTVYLGNTTGSGSVTYEEFQTGKMPTPQNQNK